VRSARVRLASLWVSQCARVLADWCLRVTAILQWARAGRGDLAWHVATAVFIAPFILLAPLNGCLSNGLPRRRVLAGSSTFALAAVAAFAWRGAPWMACLAVVALAAAVYSPARYALLPAAATDTRLPLPRVNGLIEMGGASSIIGGLALGLGLAYSADALLAVLLGLNLLALLAALPAAFPSDVLRPEPPLRAVADFFTDVRRVAAEPAAAASLLGLASFQAVVTAGSGALVAHALALESGGLEALKWAMIFVMAGAALGCVLAGVPGHPRRNLGWVPFGAIGLLAALGWAAAAAGGGGLPWMPCLLLGFTGGLVNVPLRAAYMAAVPADARGNAMAVMNTIIYVLTAVLGLLMVLLVGAGLLGTPLAQLAFLAILAALGAAASWYELLPHAVELVLEGLFWFLYRVRTFGPGKDLIPARGPLIVVANHTAYADPFWIGKIAPRHLTPLMTSLFYDLPGVRWLMVHIVGAIRVQQASFRREAPELRDAVAVLRRGGALLIFPEAQLRRTAEPGLRLFGQGVWHILQEMPQTPVVVCWIEGGWGSFSSYDRGPPMKNKRLDWRRPIDIAVEKPQVLPPEVLADPLVTRTFLMRVCRECRRYLGLEVPPGHAGRSEEGEKEDGVPGPDVQPIPP
jgi:1-acyl-sn-glycerol-3-phosphate acyltransferase